MEYKGGDRVWKGGMEIEIRKENKEEKSGTKIWRGGPIKQLEIKKKLMKNLISNKKSGFLLSNCYTNYYY